MKRLLLLAVVLFMAAGVAWGDVVVLNSMGEPDSNREGEDMPEWITGGDGSVNTTDTAGEGSTASIEWVETSGEAQIYNDHYDDPLDASCCFGYFNFYIKVAEGSLTEMGVWGTTTDWDGYFGWEMFDISGAAGEWLYVSLDMSAFDETGGDELDDLANFHTIGIDFYDATDAVILTDHWTMSTTSEEGMLEPVEPPPPPPPPISISGSGHRLLVGQDIDLAVDPGDIEPTAYQWSKDGEELGSETESTLAILSVTTDDTGDYSCLVTYDDGGGDAAYAEAEPSYYVWVTETALPLAGGLGLGLLAGACALAGVVSIRRKK